MKHLLVIAYYFPPMGLSGVQRITKFVKYLPAHGWQPTVLTVEPGGYFAFDEALMRDLEQPEINIYRTAVLDPTRFFKKKRTVALPKESSRKRLSGLSQLMFVPDNKIGWYRTAVKQAMALHHNKPFDAILATVPPYTCSLVARAVSKRCNIPYALDFRDDWLENPRHQYATSLHVKAHKYLENKAISDASSIITINDAIASAIRRRHPAAANKVTIISQGFDPEDFTHRSEEPAASRPLKFLYSGVFYDRQKPDYFLQALARFVKQQPHAAIQADFVGLVPDYVPTLVENLGLKSRVNFHGYVNHDLAISHLQGADVLWMTVGSGPGQSQISTSKLFEYIGAGKPILGLIPDGAAKSTLLTCDAAFIAPPEDVEAIETQISRLYASWEENRLVGPSAAFSMQFDRRSLTKTLAGILNKLPVAQFRNT